MRRQHNREVLTTRGVSPVIGTILMVAITVILASIVSAFVVTHIQSLTDGRPLTDYRATHENNTTTITQLSGEELRGDRVRIIAPDHATVTQSFTGTVQPGNQAIVTGLQSGDTVVVVYETANQGYVLFRTTHPKQY